MPETRRFDTQAAQTFRVVEKGLPEGVRLSHGAQKIVSRAIEDGVNEFYVIGRVTAAAAAVKVEGRSKVGPFGSSKSCFDSIQETAAYKSGRKKF